MSLTSFLNGKTDKEVDFQSAVKQIQPKKRDFKTLSGNDAFSNEFKMYAPYELTNNSYSMIIGTMFDYLARFQIAQVLEIDKDDVFKHIVANGFFNKYKEILDSTILKSLETKYKESLKSIRKFIYSANKID